MSILLFKSGDEKAIPRGSSSVISSILEGASQALPAGLGFDRCQAIRNVVSDSLELSQALRLQITDDGIGAVQALRGVISEHDFAKGQQALLLSVSDLDSTFPTTSWDIFLDGVSIKQLVQSIDVSHSETTVHNEITLQSISEELFSKADPDVLKDQARLELVIEARHLYFMLETKEGDEVGFALWGRSASARDDTPFADSVQILLDAPRSARSVCEDLVPVNGLDWQIMDWPLPKGYEYHGDAIACLQEIASAVGGIVRAKDSGQFLVRYKWPVRPINMSSAVTDVSYDRVSNIIGLNYAGEKGTGYNAVTVDGHADDVATPHIEIEPVYDSEGNESTSFAPGDDVVLRVFWAGFQPYDLEMFTSAGTIRTLNTVTGVFTEDVVFQYGRGSVQRPVYDVLEVSWIGYSSDPVHWTRNSSELTVDDPRWVIAKITYRSVYTRYLVSNHNVPELIAAFEYYGKPGVSVIVKFGDGNNMAPAISNNNLTTTAAATRAGISALDDSSYDRNTLSIVAPYEAAAMDGVLASISNDRIGVAGHWMIRSMTTNFVGPQIKQSLEVVKCRV